MTYFILALYFVCVLIFTLYSISIIHLIILALGKKPKKKAPLIFNEHVPHVTVQLPMYNEMYVANDVIDCCARFDYPLSKLEIQVLDDSTDETVDIVAKRVAYWQDRGVDITQIRRTNRTGFKAGALEEATPRAKGEFITIFDADFRPDKDFLLKTMAYFDDDSIGAVQTRWGHLNGDYSLLTQIQAISIDAFFLLEQQGRANGNLYLRFNGSGGIWRKKCIETSGGWSARTLSEDLDLVYRAQLKGWKIEHTNDVICKAELPVTFADIKNQHYRWNKGKAAVGKYLFKDILKAKEPLVTKLHMLADMYNIWVPVAVFMAGFLSIPLVGMLYFDPSIQEILQYSSPALVHSFLIVYYVSYTLHAKYKKAGVTVVQFFRQIYPFLFLFTNISFHQLRAILDTFRGKEVPFIRTPKYKIIQQKDKWSNKKYDPIGTISFDVYEFVFVIIFTGAVILDFLTGQFSFLPFHLSFVMSFGLITIFKALEKKKVDANTSKSQGRVQEGEAVSVS